MSLDDQIALFAQVPLFEGFRTEQLRLLAFGAEYRSVIKGSKLYTHGMYSDGGYIICEGRIDLVHENGIKIFGSYGPGTLVGELALITDGRRHGSALAKTNVSVYKISRALFHKILSEFPEMAELLHQRLSHSLNQFISEAERIQNHS